MNIQNLPYREVWAVDFEFTAQDGERPVVICMVACEVLSCRTLRFAHDQLTIMAAAPFDVGPGALFVAYYASAELACFLALGWTMPARVLDLCVEFKCATSGLQVPGGRGLLGALMHYGIDGMAAEEKESMRELAMRGGPYTSQEMDALLDYCETDVVALDKLLSAMLPTIDLPRALLRGRYMAAAAKIEWAGVPVDAAMLARLRAHWTSIQDRLIAAIDHDFGVYEGRSFRTDRFAAWLEGKSIPWPRLDSGVLDLGRDAFHEMARAYPQVAPLAELRHALSALRLHDLAVGSDGRARCLLGAFGSRTGRNQPSNSKFIFGPAVWLRGLIKPERGRAVAYIDYSQQEFGIAAALSGDENMKQAYRSGDPYLTFAKQAGAAPADATKETHKTVRDQFKATVLGVQYGMGPDALAQRIDQPVARARQLLALHRQTYPRYWAWSESAVAHAMLRGALHTVFGWKVHAGPDANPRSLANFPMQGNGAEVLRLACCLATERGIQVCAPVHDALLVEGPANQIDRVVAQTQAAMLEASGVVLDGFELGSDAKTVLYPDRYMDERGSRMWKVVTGLLPSE